MERDSEVVPEHRLRDERVPEEVPVRLRRVRRVLVGIQPFVVGRPEEVSIPNPTSQCSPSDGGR